jgi:glycosyltransferase involved in cell wall biosynthesis
MRMLVVSGRLFYPATTGGTTRSSRLFERLSRDHEITIVSFRMPGDTPESLQMMGNCCSRLETVDWYESRKGSPRFFADVARNILSSRAFTIAKYDSPEMRRKIEHLLHTARYDVIVADFLQPSTNVIDAAFVPKILFQHNVESVIRRRQFGAAGNPLLKAYLYWDWLRLKRFEARAARTFDHCIMVSEQDCLTMHELYGVTNTTAIPTGVDVDYFQPREPEALGHHLVFTGSMDWFPNDDAMQFFVAEVLPLIRRELDVTFWIVGRNPGESVLRLAREHADVRVTGTVDDVRPFIDRAGVYVVPLRIGGGTRIKIFEAMSMAKAVVSTTIGAEGLPVTDGRDIVLEDRPERFAEKVVRLLRMPGERRRIGDAARTLMVEHYTWDVAARRFADICESVRATVRKDQP